MRLILNVSMRLFFPCVFVVACASAGKPIESSRDNGFPSFAIFQPSSDALCPTSKTPGDGIIVLGAATDTLGHPIKNLRVAIVAGTRHHESGALTFSDRVEVSETFASGRFEIFDDVDNDAYGVLFSATGWRPLAVYSERGKVCLSVIMEPSS